MVYVQFPDNNRNTTVINYNMNIQYKFNSTQNLIKLDPDIQI